MIQFLLPQNYAEKMFDLEATLEYEGTMDLIRELNDHYRVSISLSQAGIDYYIVNEPKKATHLQKKMTSLLASPDNIRILEREAKKTNSKNDSQSPSSDKQEKQQMQNSRDIYSPILNTRKLKDQVTKFHTVASTCIQNMVENSNKVADRIERLKMKDLNRQEENLNDRILLKRVKSQEKFKSRNELTYGNYLDSSLKHMIQ